MHDNRKHSIMMKISICNWMVPMRKITVKIMLAAMLALLCTPLGACASYTDGAATTGYAFVDKMAAQKYDEAFEYIYSFSSDVQTKSDFVERFENIYDALEITGVKLMSRNVEQRGEEESEYDLTYTLQMESGLLGLLTYEFETEIVAGPLGYTVVYTPALILPMLEEGDKVRVTNQYGVRGEVFSADGKLLAQNDYAQSIYIDLDQNPDIGQVKTFLSTNFDVDADRVQRRYDNAVEKGYPLEVLATFPRETLTAGEIEQISAVEGLGVDDKRLTPIRYYPMGDNAAHVVGYMGDPSEEQIAQAEEEGSTLNVSVGKSGIEYAFEETLRGTDGRMIYIEDDKAEVKEVLWEDAKADGSDVHLTLDTNLQNTAYTLLAANCAEGQSGAAVVMDYTSGDVKAMVSYPSFDNNLFNFPVEEKVWAYYSDEANQNPLFHRATQATYMPGSAFKPFSAVPAIESGILTESSSPPITVVENKWTPQMEGWHFPTINRFETPVGGDWVFEIAMKSSDNIFFAYYALQTGKDAFMDYMRKIGIGEAPDFELPVKASNLINADTEEVSLHLLAEMGYGNGQLEVSPVQMASMYTAFANGGDMVNPTIVEKISNTKDNVETVEWENARTLFKEDTIQQSTIDMEIPAMRRVFTDGTAYQANLGNIEGLYGKTGTARMGSREINWIIALNPNDGLLYLVVLDTGLDVGSAPKQAILNGLLKPENYNNALRQDTGLSSGGNSESPSDNQSNDPDPGPEPEAPQDVVPDPQPDPVQEPPEQNDPAPQEGE